MYVLYSYVNNKKIDIAEVSVNNNKYEIVIKNQNYTIEGVSKLLDSIKSDIKDKKKKLEYIEYYMNNAYIGLVKK